MSIFVRLDAEDMALAHHLADETYATFAASRGYYRNTPASHVMGKIGEIAMDRWLTAHGWRVDPLYTAPEQVRSADLEVAGIRVEVKTWDDRWWTVWGRCVAVGQVPALREKCDSVVWLSTTPAKDSAVVHLHGWSTVADVEQAPVRWTGPKGRQVQNHQLDAEELRDPASFLDLLHPGKN